MLICARDSYRIPSILLRPMISRIADSATCIAVSSGLRLLNSQSLASMTTYCTANCTLTMFSSSVSISASLLLRSLTLLLR